MGDMQNKKMREQVKFWVKVKKARGKYLWGELTREAKKLALAVILAEYLIAGAWYMLETRGVLDYFKPKVVIIEINRAEAKQDEPVKDIKPDRTTELANIIWHLESTKGVHNYSKCEAQGKVNGIGYGIPGDGSYKCFDDHDQEMKVLAGWIADKTAQGMSESQLLCLYNMGGSGKILDCDYAKNGLNL